MKNLEEFEKALEGSKYIKLSRTSSIGTGGTKVSYTLSQHEKLSGDSCEVVVNQVTLEDGTLITSHIVTDTEYGYDSVPCGGTFFLGERVASMQLSSVLKLLPSIYKERVAAQNYLAENPDMLISKLSNVLQVQSQGLEEYNSVLKELDWNLANVYKGTTTKTRKLFKMMTRYIFDKNKSLFKNMHEVVNEDEL